MSLPTSTMIAGTMNWGKWGRNFNKTAIQQVIETYITEKITTNSRICLFYLVIIARTTSRR